MIDLNGVINNQIYWYQSSEDYAKWAAETFRAERATIERVGLLAK